MLYREKTIIVCVGFEVVSKYTQAHVSIKLSKASTKSRHCANFVASQPLAFEQKATSKVFEWIIATHQ
jgi:hypothetical protein